MSGWHNDFGHWVPNADGRYGSWVQSSEILAYDLTDPANIAETTHFDVPGSIADSRAITKNDQLVFAPPNSGMAASSA